MNGEEFLEKLGLCDPKFVEEAENAKPLKKSQNWRIALPFAACLAFAVWLGLTFQGPLVEIDENPSSSLSSSQGEHFTDNENDPVIVDLGFEERKENYYRDITFDSGGDLAYVWPWEYRTTLEKYNSLELGGKNYMLSQNKINPDLVGEELGYHEIGGYDDINDENHSQIFKIYSVKKLSTDIAVAAKIEGSYYVFGYSDYNPPKTLGEFIEAHNLTEYLPLERFSEVVGYEYHDSHGLADDSFIWEVLKGCGEAEFIPDDMGSFSMTDREYLSFTATSEALGVWNRAFYVTKDGYIRTNAFGYAYTFFIGEEAANEIIDHALENKTDPPAAIKSKVLFGIVTEVGENYFLLDDSSFCEDPEDGMVFKVMTEDIRIRRYFLCGILGEGSMIRVNFTGGIDIANENKILDVSDLGGAHITEENHEEETNPSVGG